MYIASIIQDTADGFSLQWKQRSKAQCYMLLFQREEAIRKGQRAGQVFTVNSVLKFSFTICASGNRRKIFLVEENICQVGETIKICSRLCIALICYFFCKALVFQADEISLKWKCLKCVQMAPSSGKQKMLGQQLNNEISFPFLFIVPLPGEEASYLGIVHIYFLLYSFLQNISIYNRIYKQKEQNYILKLYKLILTHVRPFTPKVKSNIYTPQTEVNSHLLS